MYFFCFSNYCVFYIVFVFKKVCKLLCVYIVNKSLLSNKICHVTIFEI
jgi:hypothetical protein